MQTDLEETIELNQTYTLDYLFRNGVHGIRTTNKPYQYIAEAAGVTYAIRKVERGYYTVIFKHEDKEAREK